MNVPHLALAAALTAMPSVSVAQTANPLTANAKVQLGALTGLVIRSAEKVPDDLYYGNLVTYMRLKNIVPPSSEAPAKK